MLSAEAGSIVFFGSLEAIPMFWCEVSRATVATIGLELIGPQSPYS